MADIGAFVRAAKKKGLDNDQIRNALVSKGWDNAVIDAAFVDLEVPEVDASSSTPSAPHASHSSLSPLMAALHHVLLWFFTSSSTVTIIGVVASLSGYSVSTEVLAAMIAVTVITFTPYAILFLTFLIKARRTPGLIPGKVWSIITICLHSIGAMAAAITLVINAILAGEFSVLLSSALILALDLLVVVTYCFAAFSTPRVDRLRAIVTIVYLPALLVLFGTLFIMSALQLGPARHDEQLREDLTSAVQEVHTFATAHTSLPENSDGLTISPNVTYQKTSKTTYKVCGVFETSNRGYEEGSYSPSTEKRGDSYVSDSQFYVATSGEHCFDFASDPLSEWAR